MLTYAPPDATQGEIAEMWEMCGWTVHDLHNAASAYRFVWHAASHAGGLPDLLCTLGPCHVWVEVKTKEGRLEPAQVAFGERAQESGEWWTVERDAEAALMEAQWYRDQALLVMRVFRKGQG